MAIQGTQVPMYTNTYCFCVFLIFQFLFIKKKKKKTLNKVLGKFRHRLIKLRSLNQRSRISVIIVELHGILVQIATSG